MNSHGAVSCRSSRSQRDFNIPPLCLVARVEVSVTSTSPHYVWLLALGSGLGDGRSYGESSSSSLVPVSVWSANAGRAARLSAGPSEGVLVRGESRLEFVEVPRPRPRSSRGLPSWEDNCCQVPRQCWSPSCCLSRFCGDVLFQIVRDQPCFRRCLLKCMPRCASAARPCWGALALPSAPALAFVFVLIKDKTDQTWTKLV